MKNTLEAIRARRYRAMHPEKKREQNARYYASSKHVALASGDRWRRRNWAWILIQVKERRAGLKATPIHILRGEAHGSAH